MNEKDFYKRISGVLDHWLLHKKRVAVIGLGSGGCRVAAELGRLGIPLLLVERPGELIEEHNIVRHLLGYRSLGKSKSTEMAEYIRNLNPSVSIESVSLDVVKQSALLRTSLQRWEADLIAACTDNEPSKHAINEVALQLNLPQTGGAVYDGGIGGEVYRVRPGEACYGCIAAQLQIQELTRDHSEVPDYNNQTPGEGGSCALNLDIEQIAILQSRMTLDLLLKEDGAFIGLPREVNVCVFANRVVPGTFVRPFHGEFFNMPRRPDCLVCGEVPGNLEVAAEGILSSLGSQSLASSSDERGEPSV